MGKRIIIDKNEVYRAKTEVCIELEGTEVFFTEVYKKTLSIVDEILHELLNCNVECEKDRGTQTKFETMGNNIVAFCGDRGQGKTSAMQSCAALLRHCQSDPRKYKSIIGDNKLIHGYMFTILDPIDPSALNHGESILKVLLSRLFILYTQYLKEFPKDKDDVKKQKKTILELFQKCYMNIDYINKSKKELEYDNLEDLFNLGNSSNLKSDLYNLINSILELKCDTQELKKCLIIQIDDLDLAMIDAFQICEDIRNYFSIPNVLVFFAVDNSKLRTRVIDNYIHRFEAILKYLSADYAKQECAQLATKYLEKLLPAGHIILLPNMSTYVAERPSDISVSYFKDENTDLFKKFTKCTDIQEQLLKLLYYKTGIIFLKQDGGLHPFLPHTMRALTHFIKLLDNMQDIPRTWSNEADFKAGLEVYAQNLNMMKHYFLNNWCGSRLNYDEYMKIKKLSEYYNDSDYIVNDIRRDPNLKEALDILDTIQYNLWFINSYTSRGNNISLLYSLTDCEEGGERISAYTRFGFDYETFAERIGNEALNKTEVVGWISAFCLDQDKYNMLHPANTINTCDKIFDLFNPLYNIDKLTTGFGLSQKETIVLQDSLEEQGISGSARDYNEWDFLWNIKDILANVELCNYINHLNNAPDLFKEYKDNKVDSIIKKMTENLDSWSKDKLQFLEMESKVGEILFECWNSTGNYKDVFMSNRQNVFLLIDDYMEKLEKKVTSYRDSIQENVKIDIEYITELQRLKVQYSTLRLPLEVEDALKDTEKDEDKSKINPNGYLKQLQTIEKDADVSYERMLEKVKNMLSLNQTDLQPDASGEENDETEEKNISDDSAVENIRVDLKNFLEAKRTELRKLKDEWKNFKETEESVKNSLSSERNGTN